MAHRFLVYMIAQRVQSVHGGKSNFSNLPQKKNSLGDTTPGVIEWWSTWMLN